jgi:hypothetical protein
MKRLLLCVLLISTFANASVTFVTKVAGANQGTGQNNFSDAAYTNNTVGDLGVVVVKWCVDSTFTATITSVTDTNTNSWTVSSASLATVTATHYASCNVQFAYTTLKAFTGTNTVTVNFSSTHPSGSYTLYELTAGALDQTHTGTNTNTATPTPGAITTASNGCFYISGGILDNGFGFANGWFTAGSGWTLGGELGGGNSNAVDEYQAQTSSGTLTATYTSGFPGTTGPNAGSIITFKIPPTGPPPGQFPRQQ